MIFYKYIKVVSFLLCAVVAFVSSAHADVVDVDNAKLAELLKEGIVIVDVRRPEEWQQTGVITDSQLMTFFKGDGSYDAATWKRSLDKVVSSKQPVILICRSGSRTALIANWLSNEKRQGKIYNVKNGILSWLQAGHETVSAHRGGEDE